MAQGLTEARERVKALLKGALTSLETLHYGRGARDCREAAALLAWLESVEEGLPLFEPPPEAPISTCCWCGGRAVVRLVVRGSGSSRSLMRACALHAAAAHARGERVDELPLFEKAPRLDHH
mgnify:CR=1 FL=1